MPDETIFCPECQSKVKVPETLLGQAVTCPLCRHTFTAPIRGGGSIGPAAPPPYVTVAEPEAASVVKTPAMALLVVGVLGFAVNLLIVTVMLRLGAQEWLQMQHRALAEWGLPPPQLDADQVFWQGLVTYGIGAAMALGVIFGATQMLRLQWYAITIVGCVLAMLNLPNACCLLGLPVGIWSLSVLLRPEVKASFQ